jgi:lysozyme family protein
MRKQRTAKVEQTGDQWPAQTADHSTSNSAKPSNSILRLQRLIGNQAVQQLVQAKLEAGCPQDTYERTADRVAGHVVDGDAASTPSPRREEGAGEGQISLTAKSPSSAGLLRGLGVGKPLSPPVRALMESRFGCDFGSVRVHTGAQAAQSAQTVGARAYTAGRDVVFGAGQYETGTNEGRRLLAHELAHVVQQRGRLDGHTKKSHIGFSNPVKALVGRIGAVVPSIQRQVKPGAEKAKPSVSVWERGQRALARARAVLEMGEAASCEEKNAASDELWAVVGIIEQQQIAGIARPEEAVTMRDLKGQLLKEIGRLMDAGVCGASSTRQREASPKAKKTDDAAFWEWWKLVAGYEGSLKDWRKRPENKRDRGGETNCGVTKKMYKAHAKGLGLPPTDEGFEAMTPDQAMLFGRMIWKASGAHKVKNTGVALVLADWYWGGIDLGRFSALLKEKGQAASFKEGSPDAATIAFMNTLSPKELIELMSDAKAAQYHKIAKRDPTQRDFLAGWLRRNEERRWQARQFVYSQKIEDHGRQALEQARAVLKMGADASSKEKRAARDELWAVVSRIEKQQKTGSAPEAMISLKGQLLKEIGRLMDAGP